MANKKITSLKRTIKKYLSELILTEKKLGGKCKVKFKIGPPMYGAWSIGNDGKYYCALGGYSSYNKEIQHIDPKDGVYKLKSANMMRETDMLNEGPYCNPDGADPSTVPGCQKHGVGCLGDGFFGTMSYNSGSDSFECGMVTPGGTGGGPLSGDDLVVKTKGGNKNPFYKPKSSIDQMMREAAKDIVRERKIKK